MYKGKDQWPKSAATSFSPSRGRSRSDLAREKLLAAEVWAVSEGGREGVGEWKKKRGKRVGNRVSKDTHRCSLGR